MVHKILDKGRNILVKPQDSVLSAATIIMVMIILSRILGLFRLRILAHFFTDSEMSLFFAAFRLPDLIFEVLVFGTFASAFIPVFTKSLKRGNSHAWDIASTVVNIGLLVFAVFALILGFGAEHLYSIFAPGYEVADQQKVAELARVLFAAQGFFVISYVLTGVLESLRRFLVPALAPLFYNLGIILGTVFLARDMHLMAPVIGVVVGAFAHFAIQLPLAMKLGFRFKLKLDINEDVKKIGKLAAPRFIETTFMQLTRMTELFFASLISAPAYTYYTFANTLQLLPVGLFGTAIAKAALPTLARQADDLQEFKKTLLDALYQVTFLVIPVAVSLIVLRIPLVRLVYGAEKFGWEATVQTSLTLSAFALSVVFQSMAAILARGFYALHNTKTPVLVSITAILITIITDYILIGIFGKGVWGLAAAFTLGSIIQATSLFYLMSKRLNSFSFTLFKPFIRSAVAASLSGTLMYFILKFFDKSVWIKRLSFLSTLEITKNLNFEKFVLDTRYTANLVVLTIFVLTAGALLYIILSLIFGSKEVWVFFNLVKRTFLRREVAPIPSKETETVAPTPSDSAN